jgi:predicted CxxxxCH...CXXCH cytochrome family protein
MERTLLVTLCTTLIGCLSSLDTPDPASQPPPNSDPQAGCALGCHGTDSSNAPPTSISGAPTWHRQIECADCHVVPETASAPGHIDGDNKAEVTFAMIAGPNAAWSGTTCTTQCHGSATLGGAHSTPLWTQVDGSQSTCGSCHGVPPPAPHPTDSNCASCHPTMEEGSLTFRDPASHINGVVDVIQGATGCTSCHGSPASSAPPTDLGGNTANTAQGVGAHVAHLATSTWHRAITCTNCHVVPNAIDAPGHRDGDNIAEVVFDTLDPAGTYTRANATCSNLYCHGTGRGNTGTKSWVTPGALACGACHSMTGTNMSGDHRKHIVGENIKCSQCHGDVVNAAQTIINANLHVNGLHEVKMANGTFNAATRRCSNTGCHGTETW